MKTNYLCFKAFVFIIAGLLFISHGLKSQNYNPVFEGYWYGVLEFQGTELILTLDIKKNNNDSLSGTINSPLQGANNIPITQIQATNDSIEIYIKSLSAHFKGRLNLIDTLLKGIFSQAIFKIPLTFNKTEVLFTLKRPQNPEPPYNYTEEEVIFTNNIDNIKLAGTLTYPNTKDRFPAVILITGSGPQNRDEEILGHKPFWVIADYLSSRGIAVLRFDDRGVGKSEGVFTTATSMDFSKDVEAAVNFLEKHPRIETSKIGLLGHSEGGIIASIVASKNNSINFVIMLAGPALTGKDILLTQQKKILSLEDFDKKPMNVILKDAKKAYHILEKNPNPKQAADALRKHFNKRAEKTPEELHITYGYSKYAIESRITAMNSSWFRYFLKFNPEDYLKNIDCPVLALFGEKDVQILATENIETLEKIIKKHTKDNFTIKLYSGKNHLFQNATTGNILEYALIEETICPTVLKDIYDWIINPTAFENIAE